MKLPQIEVGFQVFVRVLGVEGDEEVGAVRQVAPFGRPELAIYIENAGDFVVPLTAVSGVHDGKVILESIQLDPALRKAIGRAHDAENA